MTLITTNNAIGNQIMTKNNNKTEWMKTKFGDMRVPYEKTIQLENISGGVDGAGVEDANEFTYCYSRRTSSGVNETERLPHRTFKVLNPHLYDGALGLLNAKTFNNTDSIFIVNS